jgi:hypothetical protein
LGGSNESSDDNGHERGSHDVMLSSEQYSMTLSRIAALVTAAICLNAQQTKQGKQRPVQTQSSSTITSTTTPYGEQAVEIRNVSYEVTNANIPGRPADDRLLLRKTTHSRETLGEKGVEATVTLEAWRFGDDPRNKPIYTITASGTGGHTLDGGLFIASRGLEEDDWWSVYKLGSGQHLFDTHVPLVGFSISREILTQRYAGLQVPGDDIKDARLKQPNVIAVLTYASQDRVIQEALLTSDDREQATLLRSFDDVTRTLTMQDGVLRLSFSENYPSTPKVVNLLVPVAGDGLDLAHAQLPAKLHMAAWKR